jgi:hypothetical protein
LDSRIIHRAETLEAYGTAHPAVKDEAISFLLQEGSPGEAEACGRARKPFIGFATRVERPLQKAPP